ncbi:MAG: hypothetical protein FWH28_05725, partial [Clostridiales bacterium]|nr:hypothetical protein [Clostridiales bacterium]
MRKRQRALSNPVEYSMPRPDQERHSLVPRTQQHRRRGEPDTDWAKGAFFSLILAVVLIAGLAFAPLPSYAGPGGEATYAQAFPDPNFRAAVLAIIGDGRQSGDLVTVADQAALASRTALNVVSNGIADLTGIAYFSGLESLWCSDNQLTELNLSANTALADLRCDNNLLESLTVTGYTELDTLSCGNNYLTELDLSGNLKLTELSCEG